MNTPTAWPPAADWPLKPSVPFGLPLARHTLERRLDWMDRIAREEGIYRLGAALACPVADEACNAVSAPVWRLLTSGPRGVRLPAGEPKPITTRHPAPSGDAAPPRLAFAV